MEFKQKDNVYFIRLDKGENVLQVLEKFLDENNIKGGFFTGLGAINYLKLYFFNQKEKNFNEKVIEEDMEVTSLVGNITMNEGKPYIHSHIVVATKEFSSYSGHFKEGIVGATMEIVLIEKDVLVGRKFSEEIGLNLFEFGPN